MKTTFGRNFFTHTLILLVALAFTGVSFQFLVRKHLENKAVDELKNNCQVISDVASAYLKEDGFQSDEFLVSLSVAARISQCDAVICDSHGHLLLCSEHPLNCEHQGLLLSDQEYLDKLETQEYVFTTGKVGGLWDEDRYVVSTAIRNPQTDQAEGPVV